MVPSLFLVSVCRLSCLTVCFSFVTRVVSNRYTGIYLDPAAARSAFEHDADRAVEEQHKCSNARFPDVGCKVESVTEGLSSASSPFAWTLESLVQSSSPLACDAPCDAAFLPTQFDFASFTTDGDRRWQEGSWSETMKACQVQMHEFDLFYHLSFSCTRACLATPLTVSIGCSAPYFCPPPLPLSG
jgi:hypothetical protein